ncbi:MAG: phage tail sheath subtilisin-like domain-containing protein, partial [Alphaproteobacteria bacterium]|nr:phage tail sheath subtilisin-like domain-containing protein [Alphaproteobacteria bacterium]
GSIQAAPTSHTAFIGQAERGETGQSVLITSWHAYTAEFGGFAWNAPLALSVYNFFAAGGSIAYITRVTAAGSAAATGQTGALVFSAASPGLWGNDIRILVEPSSPEADPETADVFRISVLYPVPDKTEMSELNSQLMARFADINALKTLTRDDASYLVLEDYDGVVGGQLDRSGDSKSETPLEHRINTQSYFVRLSVDEAALSDTPLKAGSLLTLAGGLGDPVDTPIDLEAALQTLDKTDDISLVLVPDISLISDPDLQRDHANRILTYCEQNTDKGLFAILDMPFGLDVEEAAAFKPGASAGPVKSGDALTSSLGALYYPWVDILLPVNMRQVPTPPSGMMAGVYAQTDHAVGPWQAPAGTTYGHLSLATGLERKISADDQDTLNPIGINAIREFPTYGIVAYGARTLTRDPALVYLSVRRTLLLIETSLRGGLRYLVFEPNTPSTWAIVTRQVSDFLTDLWRQGALVGSKASEAFIVICDATNNPPEAQRSGKLVVDVSVSMIHPAEFTSIRLEFLVGSES